MLFGVGRLCRQLGAPADELEPQPGNEEGRLKYRHSLPSVEPRGNIFGLLIYSPRALSRFWTLLREILLYFLGVLDHIVGKTCQEISDGFKFLV